MASYPGGAACGGHIAAAACARVHPPDAGNCQYRRTDRFGSLARGTCVCGSQSRPTAGSTGHFADLFGDLQRGQLNARSDLSRLDRTPSDGVVCQLGPYRFRRRCHVFHFADPRSGARQRKNAN